MEKYFNAYGFIMVLVILIPNIVFAMTCKDGFVNKYQNKVVETLEQVGRFGCFICMFFLLPWFDRGFWFPHGKTVYLIAGAALVALYCLGWIIFWKENSIRKSLFLSVVPSILFLESGIVTGYVLLLLFALLFAPCHILISVRNVV